MLDFHKDEGMRAEHELMRELAQMMVNKFHAEYPEGRCGL